MGGRPGGLPLAGRTSRAASAAQSFLGLPIERGLTLLDGQRCYQTFTKVLQSVSNTTWCGLQSVTSRGKFYGKFVGGLTHSHVRQVKHPRVVPCVRAALCAPPCPLRPAAHCVPVCPVWSSHALLRPACTHCIHIVLMCVHMAQDAGDVWTCGAHHGSCVRSYAHLSRGLCTKGCSRGHVMHAHAHAFPLWTT